MDTLGTHPLVLCREAVRFLEVICIDNDTEWEERGFRIHHTPSNSLTKNHWVSNVAAFEVWGFHCTQF